MYRRSIFLDVLIAIRQEMARDADYDVDLFVERARTGTDGVGSYKIKDDQAKKKTGSRGRARADK